MVHGAINSACETSVNGTLLKLKGGGMASGETSTADQDPTRVDLKIHQAGVETRYINSFKHHPTPEEFMLDLGVNRLEPTGDRERPVEVHFNVNTRLVMNYHTAKRLALALGGIVKKYEERFGELDVSGRRPSTLSTDDLAGGTPGAPQ
jgi:hypothetical protein